MRSPERWREPIRDGAFVGAGILGIFCPATLQELTERTRRLIEPLKAYPEPALIRPVPAGQVSLQQLPGTIGMLPRGGCSSVLWANGELPPAVKRAGTTTWTWEVGEELGKPHFLVCLARRGARLWVHERLLIDCPVGLPYVPATHRCPQQSRVPFTPDKRQHQLRLELAARDAFQPASVLLASSDLHLAPWSWATRWFQGPSTSRLDIVPARWFELA